MIFDGKKFASEMEMKVKWQIAQMGKKLKIVSVMVGDDPSSLLYTKLKKQAAERVGIEFEIIKLDVSCKTLDVSKEIEKQGEYGDVSGVMVQLPIPTIQGQILQKVLSSIPLRKDVDGLRWRESGVKPATVRAILAVIDKIMELPKMELETGRFVVLGARGAVGMPLVHFLKQRGVEVVEIEWDTPNQSELIQQGDIVISCVGKAGLVTAKMIKDGAVVIDVGMSQLEGRVVGDMTQEVYQKASVAVPVPGGVGPVTIACLLQNMTEIYETNRLGLES